MNLKCFLHSLTDKSKKTEKKTVEHNTPDISVELELKQYLVITSHFFLDKESRTG